MIKSLVGSLATLTVAYAEGPPKNPISHSQWMESLTMTASNQSEIIWYQAKSSQYNEEVIKADGVNNIQLQFLEFDMGTNDDGSTAEENFVIVDFDRQRNWFQGNYSTGLLWTGVTQGDVTIRTYYQQNANSNAKGYKLLWRRVPKPTVVQPVLPLDNSETIWFPAEDVYGKTGYPNNVVNTTLIKSDGVSEIQLAFSEFNLQYLADAVLIIFDGHTTMFTGNYDMGLAWTGVAIGDVEIRTLTNSAISKTGYKLHYRKIPNNAPADIRKSCNTSTYDELLKNMKVKNVTCDAEKVTINFDDQFYQSPCLDGRKFTVGSPNMESCPQQKIDANAAIEYGFDDCLVEKTSNSTDLTFNLDFELETSIPGASVPGLILNGGGRTSKWSVSCTYDRINEVQANNSVSVSPPVIEEFVVDVAQEFTIQMETFSTSNYSAALTYPIVKNYQDSLYFQISFDDTNPTAAVGSRALSSSKTVGQSDNFHLIIESCWATPDIKDISTNNVTLIENECVSSAVSSIVEINARVNNTQVDQWTSRVFTFPDEPAVVIKCQVRICYEKADCVRDCNQSRAGRFLGSKSVQNGKTLERTVSTGTISIRNEAEHENGEDTLDDDESAGMTTGCAFFVIMICFSFM